jgi:hypothetical protein
MNNFSPKETLILPATAVIRWCDASSAESESDMLSVSQSIPLNISLNPSKLSLEHKVGQTIVWNDRNSKCVNGLPTDADIAKPSHPPYALEGEVCPSAQYLPRLFSASLAMSDMLTIVLYPTVLSSRMSRSGGCRLQAKFDADESPAVWAIVTITITIPGSGSQEYRGQCDQQGEVAIAFNRLPPLAEGVTHYSASLTIKAIENPDKQQPIHPETLVNMEVRETDSSNFLIAMGLSVVPGDVQKIHSQSKDYLAVQPVTD